MLWNDVVQVSDLVVRKREGEPGLRMAVGGGLAAAPAVEDLLQTIAGLRARVRALEAAMRVAGRAAG